MIDNICVAEGIPDNAPVANLVDICVDAAIVVDHTGEIVIANQLAAAMYGYELNELVGMAIEQLMPERFRQHHVSERRAYVRRPRIRHISENLDLYGLRSDGREFAVAIALRPVMIGEAMFILAVMRSINIPRLIESSISEMQIQLKEINQQIANAVSDSISGISTAIEASVAQVSAKTDSLERRMDAFETANKEHLTLLGQIFELVSKLASFTTFVKRGVGVVASAVIIAIAVALALKYLHLK